MLTVIEAGETLLIPDVATEGRWSPQWSERVRVAGVRSAMHLPLIVAGRAEAVLSLYSEHADGFDADDIAVAHILARHAAVAIAAARSGASRHRLSTPENSTARRWAS